MITSSLRCGPQAANSSTDAIVLCAHTHADDRGTRGDMKGARLALARAQSWPSLEAVERKAPVLPPCCRMSLKAPPGPWLGAWAASTPTGSSRGGHWRAGLGLGVGANPLKQSRGPHMALILAHWCFWAGKGSTKRKGFLLWLLYLVRIKQGWRVSVVCFPTFQQKDDG